MEGCEESVTLPKTSHPKRKLIIFQPIFRHFCFCGVTKMGGGGEDSGEGQECLFGARSF